MRVLAAIRPYVGHLRPALPFLEALAAAGHQVVVATSEELAVEVEQRGLGWLPAGVHPGEWAAEHPGDDPNYGAAAVGAKVRDLIEGTADVPVDLVMRDATDLSGLIIAELLGVPLVTYSVCHYLPRRVWRRLAGSSLRSLRAEFGLSPDRGLASLTAGPYLDVMPPALQTDLVAELDHHVVVRYEDRDSDLDSARLAAAGSPAVLVSLGTVFNGRDRLWRLLLGALSGLDVPVLATGVPTDVRDGYDGSVTLADYVPHSAVLPGCDVLVCHGGFNTVLGALLAGVPVICLPMAGDQYYNAEIVDRLGLGRRLSATTTSQKALRAVVEEVRTDPAYRERVAGVRRSIAALPSAASMVGFFESLLTRPADNA